MRHTLTGAIAALGIAVATVPVANAQDADVPGAQDYPGIPRSEGAVITSYDAAGEGTYHLLIGPGGADAPAKDVTGHIFRIAYREADGAMIDAVAEYYQDTTGDAGYEFVFGCGPQECGGLDFASALNLLTFPEMQIDPDNFGYVVLRRTSAPSVLMTFVISEHDGRVYTEINVIEVD